MRVLQHRIVHVLGPTYYTMAALESEISAIMLQLYI
jgi:hypothetical protein